MKIAPATYAQRLAAALGQAKAAAFACEREKATGMPFWRDVHASLARKGKPVSCGDCGHVWPRDPAYEVPCITCRAKIGSPCMQPSGHRKYGGEPHPKRDLAAAAAGHYEHQPCCSKRGAHVCGPMPGR